MLTEKRQVNKFILLLSLLYMVSYITRINFGAVIAEMEKQTGWSKSLLSLSVTGSFITYGAGQIISGFLGDRISPKKLISLGLIITCAMNMLIPFCQSAYQMVFVWCTNGFAQSLMWPPMVKIMTEVFSQEDYQKAIVRVSWGSSVGTILVYLIAPALITISGWKSVFVTFSVVGIIMLFVWHVYGRDVQVRKAPKEDSVALIQTKSNSMLFAPFMLLIMVAVIFMGSIRDGVTTWMPSYISDTYNLGTASSILVSVVLPIFSIVSYQVTSYIYMRKFNNPVTCASVIYTVGALTSVCLYFFSGSSVATSVVSSALLTASMHGVNFMLVCTIPAYFKKYGNVSTASGVINACTYIGSALSTYGIALLAENIGWSVALLSWMIIAILGTVICLSVIRQWSKKMSSEE